MEGDLDIQVDTDLQAQSILLAASNHDIDALRNLLRNSSANVQDEDTGFTPLHAAIAALEPDEDDKQTNGQTNGEAGHAKPNEEELQKAVRTVKLLLLNGAIWNDLDKANETPGCIANRLGLSELYEVMVDAGVRAELLLNRLDEYQVLGGDEDDEEDDEEFEVVENGDQAPELVSTEDTTVEAQDAATDAPANPDVKSAEYLASELTFTGDRLLDADKNGVMMAWETSLMQRSAELLLPSPGLRVLNVGHGMGIIDKIIQSKSPASHHIIEAHPAVIARMEEEGWKGKQGVTVHGGKWQDVVPQLVEQGVMFDAIYFDTFAEDYKALRDFFSEQVIGLLDSDGRFGFFNGLGADRKVCYDVYSKVVEMDLFEAGFDTEWEEISIPDLDANGEWDGVRRRYWALDTYRLPTCKFIG
ncbi:putative arginine N-methyltransferase [Saccharata proteae CBS 121410]|uniref:Arginine N-methyltransferase 2 n=1 Tax=Saccharata proteae CBS 121410 TaxID=1314787 RepID=A0A9P4HX96_9PEZI|nr:putative arginine N-methyltransferase [Saccharata proteae CBS 121410]